MTLQDCTSLSDYIIRAQVPGILWKANKLLANQPDPVVRNERVADVARTIALMPAHLQVVKDDYVQAIAKEYSVNRKTLEKYVQDHTVIERKKSDINRTVRKNQVAKLNGNQFTFPFFNELITVNSKTHEETFKGIKIDKLKFVQLLASFGYSRYATDAENRDGFTFVRIQDSQIVEVNPEEIKDFIEEFARKYNYDEAGMKYTGADDLINYFYDNLSKLFSKDLFARVRTESPIIINQDKEKECFLYYKNGFVRITQDGYELLPYDKMDGSIWTKQLQDREFTVKEFQVIHENGIPKLDATFTNDRPEGDYADFIWRISGQLPQRFASLCTIIGYLVHDYYDYKLKCIFLTDSTVGDYSEGRTGKTLSIQLLGHVRSYCEINGKQFNPEDEKKYQYADITTQILHINDVSHRGKNKFDFESLFNDITEGYYVRQMFKSPFHKFSKMVVSSNRTIAVNGASMRDRIIEFEMSSFFGEHRSPLQYYNKWMGKGWDEKEWQAFDNFICFCVREFLANGIIPPDTINLEARKLLDSTDRGFVEFMSDLADTIKTTGWPWDGYGELGLNRVHDIREFEFDKTKLYDKFLSIYTDYDKKTLSKKRWHFWLHQYALLKWGIKHPIERRSNGVFYIQFKEEVKEESN